MTSTLSRRTLLRGLGAAGLALPFLESMQARAQTIIYPKRFVVFYTPNGFNLPTFVPTGSGSDFQISTGMMPLSAFKSRLTMVYGTQYSAGLGYEGDGHAQGMQVMLTGRLNLNPAGNGLASGPSVDQVIAQAVGNATALKSLNLGVRSNEFGAGAWSRMSFFDSNQPVTPQHNPGAVFTSLFGAARGDVPDAGQSLGPSTLQLRRRSVLDAALADYTGLRARLGRADRLKVDAHLQSLRELERTLEAGTPAPPPTSVCSPPTLPSNPGGTWYESSANYLAVGQQQMKLMAAALACDLTRVGTMLWSGAATNLPISALGITGTGTWHDPTHTVSASNTVYTAQNVWCSTRLAELAALLDSYPEGSGTVLDNTVVMWVSEDSGNHVREHICTTLLGSCGGALKTGQFLNVNSAPKSQNDLYVSICKAMGMTTNTFGDPALCRGALAGLAA